MILLGVLVIQRHKHETKSFLPYVKQMEQKHSISGWFLFYLHLSPFSPAAANPALPLSPVPQSSRAHPKILIILLLSPGSSEFARHLS